MKGLLIRVAIDATAGGWNGPVDPVSGRFVYVPIPDDISRSRKGLSRPYSEVMPALAKMNKQLPQHLHGEYMHLDPDFSELTYGDAHPRSLPIKALNPGDFIVFYSGLASINPLQPGLFYAIIGFYLIDEIISAEDVPSSRWHENAHTRRKNCIGDTVVRASKKKSGRLRRCIEIGEYRDRAYRVKADILKQWGGLSVRDGYIQRSARLPSFNDSAAFLRWFKTQKPELIQANNE